ncbi:MAG: hypothetical protein AAFY72_19160, partial [Cyanobacteria bacterium J06649_4]
MGKHMDKKSDSPERLRDSFGRLRDRGALLFTSVLLHSLLVLIPWSKRARPLAEPSPPASPISVVDASQLPQLSISDSQQLSTDPSEPVIRPPEPAVKVSPPVNLPVPLPPDEIVFEASEALNSEPAPEEPSYASSTPTPSTSTTPTETSPTTPTSTLPSEAKIAADWAGFVGYLQDQEAVSESSTLLQIFNIFANPGQIDQFFYEEKDEDGNRQPKINVLYKHLFSEQTPEQILENVVMPGFGSDTSFKIQRQENFTFQENFT